MANRWRLKLIRPKDSIEVAVRAGWANALDDLQKWMSKDLVRAMTFGGIGIEGIAQTPFYRFISSPEGLSQLGIDRTQPPLLLRAYETKAFKVSRTNTTVLLRFGDVAKLKMATPHPAAGQGFLHVQSWLEFIVDGVKAQSGYVPRNKVPAGAQRAIRLDSPLGGLMVPRGIFGSTGSWRFPDQFKNYERDWLEANVKKIEAAILKQAVMFLQRRLK